LTDFRYSQITRLGGRHEQPAVSDLEKASDVIARAVAAGIALGRKEGLAEKKAAVNLLEPVS
jgi:hypothetical protein